MATGYSSTYYEQSSASDLRKALAGHYSEIENSWPQEFTETRVLDDTRSIITALSLYGITTDNSDSGVLSMVITDIGSSTYRFALTHDSTILVYCDFSASGSCSFTNVVNHVKMALTVDLTNIDETTLVVESYTPDIALYSMLGTGDIYQEIKKRLLQNPVIPITREEYLAQLVDSSELATAEELCALMLIFQRRVKFVDDVAYNLYREFKARLNDELQMAPLQWDSSVTVTINDEYEVSENVDWIQFA